MMLMYVEVITAIEARQIVIDKTREARELREEALVQILQDLDKSIREAVRYCELQTTVSLQSINRLVDINIPASKDTVLCLAQYLSNLGYQFDAFTNHTSSLTVRWTQ